jgi:hypothetical protein
LPFLDAAKPDQIQHVYSRDTKRFFAELDFVFWAAVVERITCSVANLTSLIITPHSWYTDLKLERYVVLVQGFFACVAVFGFVDVADVSNDAPRLLFHEILDSTAIDLFIGLCKQSAQDMDHFFKALELGV